MKLPAALVLLASVALRAADNVPPALVQFRNVFIKELKP